jgi:hypothetical protein
MLRASRSRGQDGRTTVHHFYLDRLLRASAANVCVVLISFSSSFIMGGKSIRQYDSATPL